MGSHLGSKDKIELYELVKSKASSPAFGQLQGSDV